MERIKQLINGKDLNVSINQDSLHCSPRPQASSTFMISKNDSSDSDSNKNEKSKSSNLVLSTTSSLGVIDINQESLFSECDSNEIGNWQRSSFDQQFVAEYQSQSLNQLKKRLDEISLKDSLISDFNENSITHKNIDSEINDENFGKICSSIDGSHCSSNNHDFQSGHRALLQIEQDQKENRKLFGSLPVSPVDISENNEYSDEKEEEFAKYVKINCLSPQEISRVLRNKINTIQHPNTHYPISNMTSSLRDVVSSSTDHDVPELSNISFKSSFSVDIEKSSSQLRRPSSPTSVNGSFNKSNYSIASLNEIAEILKRQSLMAEPKLAVEKLLSIGKSRQKIEATLFTSNSVLPSVRDTSNEMNFSSGTNETTLINSSEKNSASNSKTVAFEPNSSEDNLPMSNFQVKFFFSDLPSNVKIHPSNKTIIDHVWPSLVKLNVTPEESAAEVLRKEDYYILPSSVMPATNNENNASASRVNLTLSNSDQNSYGNENETIFAGSLCIGTLAQVIVIIENGSDEMLTYTARLKSVSSGNQTNHQAASVMLVANQSKMVFMPKTNTEVKIMLIPLIEGEIKVVLELFNEDGRCCSLIRHIVMHGKRPNFDILIPAGGDKCIRFNLLRQYTSAPVAIKNNSNFQLPLNLSLYDENYEHYRLEQIDQKHLTRFSVILEPQQFLRCSVSVNTACFRAGNLRGKLVVSLDTPDTLSTEIADAMRVLPIIATLTPASLHIDQRAPLIFKCNNNQLTSSHFLNVGNLSDQTLNVSVRFERFANEFTCEPSNFKLLANDSQSLRIIFKPFTTVKFRESNMIVFVRNTDEQIAVKIIGIIETELGSSSGSSSAFNILIPSQPCNPSYKMLTSCSSSSGSCAAFDGMMELDSTHSSLSWLSIPLHTRQIQSLTLRNRSSSKEKLLLLLSDNRNMFNFVENEQCIKELKLTLESKESRKILIAFTPLIADIPVVDKITIVRRNTFESSIGDFQKRVIPLFGMGGSVKLLFNNVFHDNEDRLWLTCDSNSFEAKFLIENAGNAEAFVKITLDDSDDRIWPEECTLLPSESVEINYMLQLSSDRLDMLNKQHSHKEVMLVNKLIIYSGNESTRLRLKRIWSQCDEFEKMQKIREKMEAISFESNSQIKVDYLSDEKTILTKFLYEGIVDHIISVLVPRQNLENLSLDSTVVFKDLLNFTFEPVLNS